MYRKCLNCDVPFEPKRNDHYFHNGACKAAFYRSHPNPEHIHSDLPHDEPHVCEQCGTPYNVNAYAERGGNRAPKYCSPKCKQAAYRARGQEPQEKAKRRYQADWREQRKADAERQRAHWEKGRRERAEQQAPPKRTPKMTFEQACYILGVSFQASDNQVKTAWRNKMKVVHPDVNHSPEATQEAQRVNAAYEYLKRSK